MLDSVGYFDMLYLLEKSKLVLTDSGGLQKKAYYFNKHVVVMRNETEWVELVENGIAKIAGVEKDMIIGSVQELSIVGQFSENLYGDGKASEKIVRIIHNLLTSFSKK